MKRILFVIFMLLVLLSCSNQKTQQPSRYYPTYNITSLDSLYQLVKERDIYIDSLHIVIDYLTFQVDSLTQEIEDTQAMVMISNAFVLPNRINFAGVNIDLTNDRVRSKLQGIFNIEARHAQTYIPRSGIYFDLFDTYLESYNLHPDIKYLAVAESYLNYMAYSIASAAGIWQFIPSTARAYNLKVDSYLDERRNIFKATDAACRYLVASHRQLANNGIDDWLLTLASYNAGVGNILRTVREQGSRDFLSLIMRVEETNNYIWRAIAIKIIFENEMAIFNRKHDRMPPLAETTTTKTVVANGYHDLAEWAIAQGTTAGQIWELNPWINISRTRTGRYSRINHLIIPPGTYEILVPIEAVPDEEKVALAVTKLEVKNSAPFITGTAAQYRVQRGDTLYGLARRFNVTVDNIRRWNGLSGNTIYVGQILQLQSSASTTSSSSSSTSSTSTSTSNTTAAGRYTVQQGDTISSIALKLNVSQAHLISQNNLKNHIIRTGQVLVY